ncbi:MAG: hypothetical protein Kow0037_09750 [Calditrichia bacterium]
MNRFFKITLILLAGLFLIQSVPAQTTPDRHDLKSHYERLRDKFEKARQLAGILQNARLQQLAFSIEKDLNDARRAYENHNLKLAQIYLKAATVKLRQFYSLILKQNKLQQRLKDELDRRINLAEQAVRNSDNQMAQNLLKQAKYYRRRAYRLSDNPELALQNMLMAIFFAEKAAATGSGFDKGDRSQLDRYFADTGELLRRVNENDAARQNSTAANLLAKANRQFHKAERLYQSGNINQALQQLQLVNRLLYRVMDLSLETGDALEELARDGLQDTESKIRDLRQSLSPTSQPVLYRRLQRAETLFNRAARLFREGDYKGAQNHLILANRILAQIEANQSGGSEEDLQRISRQIETARRIYESLQPPASQSAFAGKIYRLMGETLSRAGQAYQNGRYGLAIWQVRFFNHLSLHYDKLQGNLQSGGDVAQKAGESLNRLEQLLTSEVPDTSDEIHRFKTEAAGDLLQMAKEARQNGLYSQCQELANLGLKILTQ